MRLKKIEFELKRKDLEMAMQLFEEEGALKLEYEKEALDARASDSDDSAAPSIRFRSPFNWKTRRTKLFPVDSITRTNSPTCTIIVSSVRKQAIVNNYPSVSSTAKVYLNHGQQVESVPAQPENKTSLSAINQPVVVSYLK